MVNRLFSWFRENSIFLALSIWLFILGKSVVNGFIIDFVVVHFTVFYIIGVYYSLKFWFNGYTLNKSLIREGNNNLATINPGILLIGIWASIIWPIVIMVAGILTALEKEKKDNYAEKLE